MSRIDTHELFPEPAGMQRARERMVRGVLEHLRDHGNDLWREIASGVLDGSMTLRQVAEAPVYNEAFEEAGTAFTEWRDQVGQEGFEEHRQQAAGVARSLSEVDE